VVDPWDALGEFGADAIRWYLLGNSHPWLPKRFDPAGIREVQGKFFDTLRSTYRFFETYANLEGSIF
jgi:isoleucyl-tRNA synthetase